MNKAELIEFVAKQCDFTKVDAQSAVEAVFDGIRKTVKKGQDARFVGFGTFTVAKRAATTGRNPRTGEPIKIKASKNVKFKAGKELKEAVNKKK